MGYTDLHTHTTFCDGRATPEEMVLSAIDKGITTLGLLAHSYVDFDVRYAIDPTRVEEFRSEVKRLKEKYKDKIEILLGIEADAYATEIYGGCDYIIGSVHYFKTPDGYRNVDMSREVLEKVIDEVFGGDPYLMAEEYYRTVERVGELCGANIVGHFDLVMKFNEDGTLFDKANERYRAAWQRAADRLLGEGLIFEINTGAIARGRRTEPYPDREILDYIKARGARLILSSDAHFKEKLAYDFDKYEYLLN
ncbi:MAG: histidinol-phosphatase [Clostridia bacterium]|nr:histidinol-phosphatase [Clostridia bacterium]